ncbi:hypothetical protein A33K_16278 [Burkholderia humptydooensis MSMB43]|uniref:Uncharacterized protein n=1 Tax=Burkholderia humptydooensis MSMB43 TaxID=441157 RepID=A0ABN0G3H7_9BURK|nr:hypothetical protein A33K_16278 [Burkholderia humptydooensis MSMB43]
MDGRAAASRDATAVVPRPNVTLIDVRMNCKRALLRIDASIRPGFPASARSFRDHSRARRRAAHAADDRAEQGRGTMEPLISTPVAPLDPMLGKVISHFRDRLRRCGAGNRSIGAVARTSCTHRTPLTHVKQRRNGRATL